MSSKQRSTLAGNLLWMETDGIDSKYVVAFSMALEGEVLCLMLLLHMVHSHTALY